MTETKNQPAATYKDAGVDLEEAERAVNNITRVLGKSAGVLSKPKSFAGLLDAKELLKYKHPVLAATTDGVGTKVLLAKAYERLGGLGADLVNHCVNDLLVQGATPLFFTDYIAQGKLNARDIGELVDAMAKACREAGCELLGGESAEMPGVYQKDALDLVGTLVGVVEKNDIIDGSRVQQGDRVIALVSNGPHTNGYSLIRHLCAKLDLNEYDETLGATPIERLLKPHRSYLGDLNQAKASGIDLRAIVHVTGGGIAKNAERVMPDHLSMHLSPLKETPSIFRWLQKLGNVSDEEMYRVFNMGMGMLVVVSDEQAKPLCELLGPRAQIVGQIESRTEASVIIEGIS